MIHLACLFTIMSSIEEVMSNRDEVIPVVKQVWGCCGWYLSLKRGYTWVMCECISVGTRCSSGVVMVHTWTYLMPDGSFFSNAFKTSNCRATGGISHPILMSVLQLTCKNLVLMSVLQLTCKNLILMIVLQVTSKKNKPSSELTSIMAAWRYLSMLRTILIAT
jgi:hypothetical protein